jgi:transglutaminase-like putative cysteine protease
MGADRNDKIFLGLAVILGFMYLMSQSNSLKVNTTEDKNLTYEPPAWLVSYRSSLPAEMQGYIKEDMLYDYESLEIKKAIVEIITTSESLREAVDKTLDYTYYHVNYDWNEPDSVCFNSKASSILASGIGQCDTMSRVNIAILRGMGIAARPEGGCLSVSDTCGQTFAIVGGRAPITQEIQVHNNMGSRAGGLHAWLEIYLPDEGGWVDGESTSGKIIEPSSCLKFTHELYPTSVLDECVSTDLGFINMCRGL